jgi:hypothetical protein
VSIDGHLYFETPPSDDVVAAVSAALAAGVSPALVAAQYGAKFVPSPDLPPEPVDDPVELATSSEEEPAEMQDAPSVSIEDQNVPGSEPDVPSEPQPEPVEDPVSDPVFVDPAPEVDPSAPS